jgi:hypothetical protein
MEKKDSKLKTILGVIVTILLLLLYFSWTYGIKITTDENGDTVCYNIYDKRVSCN